MTKKELIQECSNVVRVGYCGLQYLCRSYQTVEIGHNSGVYGWNWTAYLLRHSDGRSVAICTGYRSLTGENVKGLEKFENAAREVAQNFDTNYGEKEVLYQNVIDSFVDYVLNRGLK